MVQSKGRSRYRLAVIASHPVHYLVGFYRALARAPQIDLTVYYCSSFGIGEAIDPTFNARVQWYDSSILEGYRRRFLRNYSPRPGPWPLGFFNPGMVAILVAGRFDALLLQGYSKMMINWVAASVASLCRTPVLLRAETVLRAEREGWRRWSKRAALRTFFQWVSAFLPIGTRSREFYLHHGIPEERLFLAPYSVDNDFFMAEADKCRERREEIRGEIGISGDLPVVLYASKMIARKRPRDLLLAFERLDGSAALLMVGDGPVRPALERYVSERRLKNVFFVDFQKQAELPRYYAAADIFVLPSGYDPWGLVINEAMCAALPIVTTDKVAAAADLVRREENGYIVRVGDIEGLSRAIGAVVSNPHRRQSMGRRSKEIISSWNYDACVEGVLGALGVVCQVA